MRINGAGADWTPVKWDAAKQRLAMPKLQRSGGRFSQYHCSLGMASCCLNLCLAIYAVLASAPVRSILPGTPSPPPPSFPAFAPWRPERMVLSRVRFTAHALEVARRYNRAQTDVAEMVVANHTRRKRNPGSAAWRVSARGKTVLYEWPDGGDAGAARVVTLWPSQ